MKVYWASSRMVSMDWEMHGVEDRRTGGGAKDGVFQHCTAHSTLSELPSAVGTGISSAVAHTRDRHSQCCCRDGRTGAPSSVGTGVWAQSLTVPGNAMGMSVWSMTTCNQAGAAEWDGWPWWGTGTGLVLQELHNTWG